MSVTGADRLPRSCGFRRLGLPRREVGQLYNAPNSKGTRWAEVTVVGIAAATKPGATFDSVLSAIFDHCDRAQGASMPSVGVIREFERGLMATEGCSDFREMR
jgi:hypothetical protein